MLTVAYLANQFPSPVEPYVAEEIAELRSRGVDVVPGSVRRVRLRPRPDSRRDDRIIIRPVGLVVFLKACWLCLSRGHRILDLLLRIFLKGSESPVRRVKALIHTGLGACYAAQLQSKKIDHIHVHHGYFGSWIGLVASRLLGVGFSLTLHGSDLLLHAAYLDKKLEACKFCLTVSNYNRRYVLDHYPATDTRKIIVARLGVALTAPAAGGKSGRFRRSREITIVAVGRLHPVKDHAFLLRACAQMKVHGLSLDCLIAGDGPERRNLESLIRKFALEDAVTLLGHVPREQMNSLYDRADVVVLTSRSEGVPLVLMEAMARGIIVLAPAITGIPELVVPGKTGFLYEPQSQGDFVARLLFIHSLLTKQRHGHGLVPSAEDNLDWVRHGARTQVSRNFNRQANLEMFADLFLQQVSAKTRSFPDENLVLQQI